MSQVTELLKYQQEDAKLLQIEREAAQSAERKNYTAAKSFLTKAPERLDALDAKAREIAHLMQELEKKYKDIAETLADFDNIDDLLDGGADIAFYKKNITQLTERLHAIKGEISSLIKSVKDADEEYQALKKKTIQVQKQYAEYLEVYKKYKDGKMKEMQAVQANLDVIAKNLDAEVLKRYQAKRSERIFPILCEVVGGRCSKCGGELSLAGKEKVDAGKVVECDNCHRILYSAGKK